MKHKLKKKRNEDKLALKMEKRRNIHDDPVQTFTPVRIKASKKPPQKVDPHVFLNRPNYKQFSPEEVIIECVTDSIVSKSGIVEGPGFRPIIKMRHPQTKEWGEVWRLGAVLHTESEALMALGRMFPLVATKHSLMAEPEFKYFNKHKADAMKEADKKRRAKGERRAERLKRGMKA